MNKPTTFWHAYLETRNFAFDAYGKTEAGARRAMGAAWRAHQREYSGRNVASWSEFNDDVCVDEVMLGAGYRDREQVYPRK